jgi:hypothetical protein
MSKRRRHNACSERLRPGYAERGLIEGRGMVDADRQLFSEFEHGDTLTASGFEFGGLLALADQGIGLALDCSL